MLVHGHFPTGYDKYKDQKAGIPGALNEMAGKGTMGSHDRLQRWHWLDDAVRVRDRFCASRPQPIQDHCGEKCVVALKMHLNNYIDSAHDQPWIELITSPDVAVVVQQRGGFENYCSIIAAKKSGFWGHNPSQEGSVRAKKADEVKRECLANAAKKGRLKKAVEEWSKEIDRRFEVTRKELRCAEHSWLDLPFEDWAAGGGGEPRSDSALKILDHIGLGDPEVWDTCGLQWCANYSWPWTHVSQ